MKIGALRFFVDIQEPVETKGQLGDTEQTWTHRANVWAAIDPIRGDEKFSLMQQKATVDTKITIRGNAAPYLTPKMRFVHNGRVFDIESIVDMQSRGIMTEVYCKEAA